MRFNCGPTPEERFDALHRWHRYFAWAPVRLGHNDCRWLEHIERKGKYLKHGCWSWEYRHLTLDTATDLEAPDEP